MNLGRLCEWGIGQGFLVQVGAPGWVEMEGDTVEYRDLNNLRSSWG